MIRLKVLRFFILLQVSMCCVPQIYGSDIDTVHLAIGYIPHIQFAPLYVGIEKGFYEQEGIHLTIEYGFGIDIFSLLLAERIDLGLSDSDQLIIAGSKGLPLAAVFQYYQQYPVTILAKQARISSPEDFVGKRIGTPQLSGTSYIGLLLFLEHFGLTGDVTIEKIGYTQVSSLLSDKIEGAVCFYNNEPLSSEIADIDTVKWDVKDFSSMVGAAFITSQAIIDKRTDVIGRFVKATRRAQEYTCANQQEALALSKKYIGPVSQGSEDFLAAVLEATCDLFRIQEQYGHLKLSTYTQSIAVLKRLGLITQVFPANRIIHPFD